MLSTVWNGKDIIHGDERPLSHFLLTGHLNGHFAVIYKNRDITLLRLSTTHISSQTWRDINFSFKYAHIGRFAPTFIRKLLMVSA